MARTTSMDLNRIALLFAGLPTLSLFWRSVRAPHRPLGWVAVTALVLLSELAGWLWFRDYAGYISATLAFLVITLPLWLHGAAARAGNRSEFRRARRLFALAALLHPLDDWASTPRLYEAFELAHAGKTAEAEALLQLLARGPGSLAVMARAQRLRVLGRWRELKALAEQSGLAALRREPALLGLYLRALGELGYVGELAEFMMAQERTLGAAGVLDVALLYLFVFSGQIALTRQALAGTRQAYSDQAREFWLALAAKHAQDTEQARRMFGQLRRATDAQIRERAEEHFRSLTLARTEDPPSARTLYVVQHFAQSFGERQNLIPNSPTQRRERRMTLLLLLTNALVYVVGGARPWLINTREGFGKRWAFFAPDILAGEWWRSFGYLFVHANAIHLAMNLGGLWVLGPFVERAFGRLRFSLIYLFSGLMGSAVYLGIACLGGRATQLVGASGCIMGLLGATAAVMLRAWLRQRAAIARQIFLRLLAVVALQVAFDYTTPEVAGLAHAVGLLAGFLAGWVLREGVSAKRSVASLA